MIQAVVKLHFVQRYCNPSDGWRTFIDIDASEEGRTGSPRKSDEAKARLERMVADTPEAIRRLSELGAFVRQRQRQWKACFKSGIPCPSGDPDVVAVHPERKWLWIAEIEGDSSGQPEGKIYRALGQLVCAAGDPTVPGFQRFMTAVVWGNRAAHHLARARAIERLGISGFVVDDDCNRDRWLFGGETAPPNITLQRSGARVARSGR